MTQVNYWCLRVNLLKILSVLAITNCYSQQELKIDYLGQQPPGMEAKIFAPGIVSTNLYEHSAPAFSPDGTVVLWTVIGNSSPAYLLEMKYENGSWTKPAKPSFADTTADDFYPSFSPDGKKLYFSSRRKVPRGYAEDGDIRIWEIERNENGWGKPMLFDTAVAKGHDYAHSITRDGTLYFSSRLSGGTNFVIRRSGKVSGRNTAPVLLPYNINSIGYEDGPYIAPDESFLIFESQRPEGYLRLYITFRQKDGSWSLPVDMGSKINSGKGERFARLSPDGKYLFFGSARNMSSTSRGADIFWIDAKVIDELRKENTASIKIIQPLGDELIRSLDKNDTIQSATLLKQWLEIYPGNIDAAVIYSSVLRKQQRYAEAEQFLLNNSVWQGNADIIMEKALMKYAMNKDDDAVKLIAPILTTGDELRGRYLFLSGALFDMKRFAASDEYFEKAMSIYAHGVFWYNRACGYTHIGEKDRAFAALNKALDSGYNEKKQYLNDPDLVPLQSDARWNLLLKKLK